MLRNLLINHWSHVSHLLHGECQISCRGGALHGVRPLQLFTHRWALFYQQWRMCENRLAAASDHFKTRTWVLPLVLAFLLYVCHILSVDVYGCAKFERSFSSHLGAQEWTPHQLGTQVGGGQNLTRHRRLPRQRSC